MQHHHADYFLASPVLGGMSLLFEKGKSAIGAALNNLTIFI